MRKLILFISLVLGAILVLGIGVGARYYAQKFNNSDFLKDFSQIVNSFNFSRPINGTVTQSTSPANQFIEITNILKDQKIVKGSDFTIRWKNKLSVIYTKLPLLQFLY